MLSKAILVSSMVSVSLATWPPVRTITCGPGAVPPYTGNCCPVDKMTQYACSGLARAYISGKCEPPASFVHPTSGVSYLNRAVSWIGPGSDAPCVDKAKKLRKNPARYCASVGSSTKWGDGGCRLWDECPLIVTKDVCNKHPWCEWRGMCQYRNGNTQATVPRG